MLDFLERTWAVIHLDRLDDNLEQIRRNLPTDTKIMGVVKADGYGHGDKMIAGALRRNGVDFFAVSNLDEAISLRNGGIDCDILILGFTPVCKAGTLLHYNITQTVFSAEYAALLDAEVAALNELECGAQSPGTNSDSASFRRAETCSATSCSAPPSSDSASFRRAETCRASSCSARRCAVHIKIDTGMGRLGFAESNQHSAAAEVAAVCALPHLQVNGIFTHLSSADMLDEASEDYTQLQVERYQKVLRDLSGMGVSIPLHHLQNSAGIAFLPKMHFDYARAGIVMYGVAPSGEKLPFPLKPVMELKTVVSMVKTVEAGSAISYGRTFVADRPMKLATVPIGYADGYPRSLSNRAFMLIHGKRVRVVGNVCMDQLMLDVSDIDDVKMGDAVTVVGSDGGETVSFDELAELTGSIPYELMCLIGRRVPRVYMQGENMIEVVDYIRN